jgi:DNA-binding response OmpR family regulator
MNLIKELKELASTKSLLIVEDEIELNDELVDLFEIFFKSVESAYNGEEGLNKILEKNYDIIITDANMPVLDGFGMIKKLRDLNNHSKIIVLSGRMNENEGFIQNLNVDYYSHKPYDFNNLCSYIIESLSI